MALERTIVIHTTSRKVICFEAFWVKTKSIAIKLFNDSEIFCNTVLQNEIKDI